MTEPKFDVALLIRLYADQPLAVDQLPYTPELAAIVKSYQLRTGDYTAGESVFYYTLMTLRKRGALPKKGRGQPATSHNP